VKSLFQLLAGCPLWLLHAFGSLLGWISFLSSPTYRKRFLANAAQAGYGFAAIRRSVGEAGKLVGEVPRLWFGAMPPVEWEGAELVEAARAKQRGIVFLTPHLGCFEITAQAYAVRFGAVTVLYRPARKPWLQELIATARSRPNLSAVPATLSGVRAMLKTLRSGGTVGLLPDQVPPQGLGTWAPFFGQPAYTMTLPARLVQQTGCELLLIWGERLPAGRGYRVRVREWGAGPLAAEAEAAAGQVNAQMERLVRECPTQYLWGYARYKPPRQGAAA
jgi:KDO2-lipid IV(A) lauroyltransferase